MIAMIPWLYDVSYAVIASGSEAIPPEQARQKQLEQDRDAPSQIASLCSQ